MWKEYFSCKKGATAIEYAVIGAFVSIAIVAAAALLGDNVAGNFNDTADQVTEASRGASGN